MKTIKVTIAVAVDAEGNWIADGMSGRTRNASAMFATDTMNNPLHVHFVTAEIPFPEDIIGEVETKDNV